MTRSLLRSIILVIVILSLILVSCATTKMQSSQQTTNNNNKTPITNKNTTFTIADTTLSNTDVNLSTKTDNTLSDTYLSTKIDNITTNDSASSSENFTPSINPQGPPLFSQFTVTLEPQRTSYQNLIPWTRIFTLVMLAPKEGPRIDHGIQFKIKEDHEGGTTDPIIKLNAPELRQMECLVVGWSGERNPSNQQNDKNNINVNISNTNNNICHNNNNNFQNDQYHLNPHQSDFIPASLSTDNILTVDFSVRPIEPNNFVKLTCSNVYLDYNTHGNKPTTMIATYQPSDTTLPALQSFYLLATVTEPFAEVFNPLFLSFFDEITGKPVKNLRNFSLQLLNPIKPIHSTLTFTFSEPIVRKSLTTSETFQCTTGVEALVGTVANDRTLLLEFTKPLILNDYLFQIRCLSFYLDFTGPYENISMTITNSVVPSNSMTVQIPAYNDDEPTYPQPGKFAYWFAVDLYDRFAPSNTVDLYDRMGTSNIGDLYDGMTPLNSVGLNDEKTQTQNILEPPPPIQHPNTLEPHTTEHSNIAEQRTIAPELMESGQFSHEQLTSDPIPNQRDFIIGITALSFEIDEVMNQNTLSWRLERALDVVKPIPNGDNNYLSVLEEQKKNNENNNNNNQKVSFIEGHCELLNEIKQSYAIVDFELNQLGGSTEIIFTFSRHFPKDANVWISCKKSLYLDFSLYQDLFLFSTMSYNFWPKTVSGYKIPPVQDVIGSKIPLFDDISFELKNRYDPDGFQNLWTRSFILIGRNSHRKINSAMKLFAPLPIFENPDPNDVLTCKMSVEPMVKNSNTGLDNNDNNGNGDDNNNNNNNEPTTLSIPATLHEEFYLATFHKSKRYSIVFDFTNTPVPPQHNMRIDCNPSLIFNFQQLGSGTIPLSFTAYDSQGLGNDVTIGGIDDGKKTIEWDYDITVPIRNKYQAKLYVNINNIPGRSIIQSQEKFFKVTLFFEHAVFLQQPQKDIPLSRSIHNLTISWTTAVQPEPEIVVMPLYVGSLGQIDPIFLTPPDTWMSFTLAGVFATYMTDDDLDIGFRVETSNSQTTYGPSERTQLRWGYNDVEIFGKNGSKNGIQLDLGEVIEQSTIVKDGIIQQEYYDDGDDSDDDDNGLSEVDNVLDYYHTLLESSNETNNDLDYNHNHNAVSNNESNNDTPPQIDPKDPTTGTINRLAIIDLYFSSTKAPINTTMTMISNSSQTPKTSHLPSFWYNSTLFPNPATLNCTIPTFSSNNNNNNNNDDGDKKDYGVYANDDERVIVPVRFDSKGQKISFKFENVIQLSKPLKNGFRLYCPDIGILHHDVKNPILSFTVWGERGDWEQGGNNDNNNHPLSEILNQNYNADNDDDQMNQTQLQEGKQRYYSYTWITSLNPQKRGKKHIIRNIIISIVVLLLVAAIAYGAWRLFLSKKYKRFINRSINDDDGEDEYYQELNEANTQHSKFST